MKTEILKLLRESQTYISGQELCDHFGVSRTAVWKVMNQLKQEGYQIEAVRNKGYHLVTSPEVLSKEEIASRLQTSWAGRNLVYYDETVSTNTDAKRLAEEGAPHGTLVVADVQTGGKGRRGRHWISPAGTNISMTLLLKPDCAPEKASQLTLIMALAATRALMEVTGMQYQIKWPNDIVLNHKKVSGTLTEMSADMDCIHYVVIGTGINVNQTEFAEEIKDMATSVLKETGTSVSRAVIIERTMYYFEQYYEIFRQTLDLSSLKQEYDLLLANKDAVVKVLDPKGEYQGIARGIMEHGELVVEREDGTCEHVYAGEVSVRGLYGYV